MNKLLFAFAIGALAFAPSYSLVAAPTPDASSVSSQPKLPPDVRNKTDLLSDAEADQIAADLKNRIVEEYGPKYNFENFTVEFNNEQDKGEVVGIDVDVNTDMILTQDPAHSAYGTGIRQDLAELTDPAEKAELQKEIDRFLNEAGEHYNAPSNSWFLYHIEVPEQGSVDGAASSSRQPEYTLFGREDITADETILTPLKR
ncbi:hypothetical protein CDO73_00920 [Saccharibacillus sp. O23]|uniref:hypothetical protein n=1 Tax=Saccharibacillus sp. O23 TaxID=2009338 RepID=UPI000B4E6E5F|nr:hypothetical protein [Saccharibacillus sp. O23]OWR33102.1 hypothetical protein CDO73_00920 [Saccharibacillus sp. O23]